jgi:hypothetical protein
VAVESPASTALKRDLEALSAKRAPSTSEELAALKRRADRLQADNEREWQLLHTTTEKPQPEPRDVRYDFL